jgi:hypothetical protein
VIVIVIVTNLTPFGRSLACYSAWAGREARMLYGLFLFGVFLFLVVDLGLRLSGQGLGEGDARLGEMRSDCVRSGFLMRRLCSRSGRLGVGLGGRRCGLEGVRIVGGCGC